MTTENYRRGVGRLVTDRYDFQDHIDGYSLAHNSSSILLNPNLTINSVLCTNSQTAFTTVANYINTFTFPDATASVKGVVKLAGDLAGLSSSAAIPKVSGIQGYPISTLSPSSGDVLTWKSGGYWEPSIIPNQFTAGGDLYGTDSDQKIINITGYLGTVSVNCGHITFGSTFNPVINQTATTIGAAANLTINAQTSSVSTGGNVNISAGFGSPTGALTLRLNNQATTLLEIAQPNTSKSVLSLVKGTPITNTEMPVGTGDKVIYISNAATAPVNPPVGGAILYVSSGTLNIKESNGNQFQIMKNNNALIYINSLTMPNGWSSGSGWVPFFTTSESSYYDTVTNLEEVEHYINNGDIIKVSFNGIITGDGWIQLRINLFTDDGWESDPINGTETYINSISQQYISLTGLYNSNGEGNVKVYVGMKSALLTPMNIYGGASLIVEVIRPTP